MYRKTLTICRTARLPHMMGMFSTHFREPHRPSDRELQITDVYIRLVSSLITRAQGEEMLRAARDVANRANQVKSRFLATASHDLRQPLQTLALLTGTLRRVSTNATADEALAQQELAISGMSRLLNTLLDIRYSARRQPRRPRC